MAKRNGTQSCYLHVAFHFLSNSTYEIKLCHHYRLVPPTGLLPEGYPPKIFSMVGNPAQIFFSRNYIFFLWQGLETDTYIFLIFETFNG
jgi:hypothetical protein